MVSVIVTTIFLNIPTGFITLYAELGMLRVHQPLSRLILWTAATGGMVPILRAIPPFGLHVPLMVLVNVLVLRHLSGKSWPTCLLATLIPNLMMVVAEGLISVPVIYGMWGITLAEGLKNPWVTVAGGWISNLLIVLLCLYFLWRDKKSGRGADLHESPRAK